MSPLPATQSLPGWYSVQSFLDIDGHLVKNTALSVVASGGSVLASLYNADGSASANPMPTSPQLTTGKAGGADGDGNVQFGAAAGLYDLYAGATYIGTVEVTAQDADLLHTHGDETKHGVLNLRDGLGLGTPSLVPDVTLVRADAWYSDLGSDAKIGVAGGYSNNAGFALPRTRNPGIGNSDMGLVFVTSPGGWGTDSLAGDTVLWSDTGRILFTLGSATPSLAQLTPSLLNLTVPLTVAGLLTLAGGLKLPTGTAGYVLQSDASGNLTLGAPPAATPNQWTENDQSTSGAVTIAMASGGAQQVTLTGNVTSCTVTGAAKGMVMVLRLKQDATGGRTWTWFTNVVWGPMGVPNQLTAPNAQQTFTFEYDGTNWVEVSRTPYLPPGTELAYQAMQAADVTVAGDGAAHDVTSLSITFVATSKFLIQSYFSFVSPASQAQWVNNIISDSAGTAVGKLVLYPSAPGNWMQLTAFARLPNAGYAITPGNTYTFKTRASVPNGVGTLTIQGTTATGAATPGFIRAVAC